MRIQSVEKNFSSRLFESTFSSTFSSRFFAKNFNMSGITPSALAR